MWDDKTSPPAIAVAEPAEETPPLEATTDANGQSDTPWRRWEFGAYAAILILALALRLWDLGGQALHHDESLHAVYSWYLYDGRGYLHNPLMHGPFQFFGTAAIFWVLWDSDFTARLLPAIFGVILVGTPILLRPYLGRSGALITSVLLTLSPSFLYFSRFARNDIYMAVWVMLCIGFIWRYLDSGKARYLVGTAAALALAFSTKESTFIVVGVLGSYLLIRAAPDVFPWLIGRKSLKSFSRSGDLVVLIGTLTLPLTGAGIAIFQNVLGLTLANPDSSVAPHGIPIGSGLFVAFAVVAALSIISPVIGLRWKGNGALAWLAFSAAWGLGLFLLMTVISTVSGNSLMEYYSLMEYFPPLALIGLSVGAIGVGIWRKGWWLVSFGVFFTIWALLHTTFFTNPAGLGTGIWQSLGYWVVQQDVARGAQPWYYYIIIGLNYEFLAMVFGGIAVLLFGLGVLVLTQHLLFGGIGILLFARSVRSCLSSMVQFGGIAILLFARSADSFSRFLVYWAVLNFLLYTYASEKMPWLLVGVSLPFLVLAGKLLGQLWDSKPWAKPALPEPDPPIEETEALDAETAPKPLPQRVHWPAIALSLSIGLLTLATVWGLTQVLPRENSFSATETAAVGLIIAVLLGSSIYLLFKIGGNKGRALLGLSLAVAMIAVAVPSSFRAAYANADIPVEMLVYTQTAPDIPDIMNNIERLGEETGKGRDINVRVDSSDGYSWPWAWYLRNYSNVGYPCWSSDAGCQSLTQSPEADVVLLSARNQPALARYLTRFQEGERYKHRWWFPENYRELTPAKVASGFSSRESWCTVVSYFWNREMPAGLGSSDGYAYFPAGFDTGPIGGDAANQSQC